MRVLLVGCGWSGKWLFRVDCRTVNFNQNLRRQDIYTLQGLKDTHPAGVMDAAEVPSLASSLRAAARTGFAGFFAMGFQVTLLMWIRTCMNYQYKHGGSMAAAFKVLYAQGGIRRFYSGYSIAVFQAPLGRFFDPAANSAVLALFVMYPAFENVPTFVKTMAASATAASFKVGHYCTLCFLRDGANCLVDSDATHSLGFVQDHDASRG